MTSENKTTGLPVWIHIPAILGITAIVTVSLLGLHSVVAPLLRSHPFFTRPVEVFCASLIIGASLWWVVLGLRKRTPPLPLLRPGRARVMGAVLLWLLLPVCYFLIFPITNLYIWIQILKRFSKDTKELNLILVSISILGLCYLISSTIISLTRYGEKRAFAFVIAYVCMAVSVAIVVGYFQL